MLVNKCVIKGLSCEVEVINFLWSEGILVVKVDMIREYVILLYLFNFMLFIMFVIFFVIFWV